MQKELIDTSEINQLLGVKPRKGDLKKLEIINAAIECISSIGYEKTTYDAIAKKIGTNRAHINYYFQNKSDIFKSAIQYIYAYYKSILQVQLDKSDGGLDELMKYIESPFIWAKKNPEQMSVMLMFYYLCVIDKKYRSINTQIRNAGVERINLILQGLGQEYFENSSEESLELAKQIQNLITGSIIDSATTKSRTLTKAMNEVKTEVTAMLDLRKIHE